MPRWADENVLVGFDTADDAGVYKLTAELALVQTVDFFTPIVDDPFTYGAIAAANALSDVYAMGGRPISALTILAWPPKEDPRDLEEILKGGADKMHEAGCAILGGQQDAVLESDIAGLALQVYLDPSIALPGAGCVAETRVGPRFARNQREPQAEKKNCGKDSGTSHPVIIVRKHGRYHPTQKVDRSREGRRLSQQAESKVVGQGVGERPALG